MRMQSLSVVAICVSVLAGCGSDSAPSPSPDTSGQANGDASSQQGDTASGSRGNQGTSSDRGNARTAGGSTAGGDISAGMRVPDRPSHPRQGNQGRQANSGGGRAAPSPARGAGNQPEAPIIPDQLASDMADARYAEFRSMCRNLFALRDEMKPLEHALAVGSATPEQVNRFNELDAAARQEHQRLNKYTWNDRWSADDRRVMAMIMSMPR